MILSISEYISYKVFANEYKCINFIGITALEK